jgi:hypothetical protein
MMEMLFNLHSGDVLAGESVRGVTDEETSLYF